MTTCLDTNVLSALLRNEQGASPIAAHLNAARQRGPLVIHVSVFAELLAAPDMTRGHLEAFLQETGVQVDPGTPLAVWEQASAGFAGYSRRRQGLWQVVGIKEAQGLWEGRRPEVQAACHTVSCHVLKAACW